MKDLKGQCHGIAHPGMLGHLWQEPRGDRNAR
jgi:hypothetical protein